MWPNPQETADLVTFTEEKSLMENFIFSAVTFSATAEGVSLKAVFKLTFSEMT